MLSPKKTKYRKKQKGRMKGMSYRGSKVAFGEFGLVALDCAWVTARQIEAARMAITRHVKRSGKLVRITGSVKVQTIIDLIEARRRDERRPRRNRKTPKRPMKTKVKTAARPWRPAKAATKTPAEKTR